MILLDAYALIAFLVGGPAAPQVRSILREGGCGLATANLVEVLDVSQRVHGLPIPRALELIDPLFEDVLRPVPLDVGIAHRAAVIRASHYHRASRPISLADSVLIASVTPDDRLATSDPDVLAVAHAENLQSITLPAQG